MTVLGDIKGYLKSTSEGTDVAKYRLSNIIAILEYMLNVYEKEIESIELCDNILKKNSWFKLLKINFIDGREFGITSIKINHMGYDSYIEIDYKLGAFLYTHVRIGIQDNI